MALFMQFVKIVVHFFVTGYYMLEGRASTNIKLNSNYGSATSVLESQMPKMYKTPQTN